ncbi:MAG: insulinase family protein [Rhizomicrobium sp.]
MGGDDNAFTTQDYTAFYEQIARDRLKLAMGLEADRMQHLALTDAGVRTERAVVLEERRMRIDDNPQSLANEQVAAALYLSHPYGRPVIGWPQEVERAGPRRGAAVLRPPFTRPTMRSWWSPATSRRTRSGPTPPARWRVSPRARWSRALPMPSRCAGETRLSIARADAKIASFGRTWRVPSYVTARPGQAEALEVLAAAVGGDANALLYRRLVIEQNLATDAGASL